MYSTRGSSHAMPLASDIGDYGGRLVDQEENVQYITYMKCAKKSKGDNYVKMPHYT